MKIIAMIERSVGNESVGEMWTETKSFESAQTLDDVYEWASKRVSEYLNKEEMKTNIKLSIDQQ